MSNKLTSFQNAVHATLSTYPFIWAFAPMPEENIFSSPVQISCSTNTFYQESIQLTFEMTCLTHDDSSKNNASLIELFDGTHFVKMVKISTGNCTDEAELLLLSLKGQQSEKDDILEAVPAVTEDTIICLVIGPYPKIAKVSFQTACLDLQNITRNNSFSALNSEGTHNITINVKISSKDCKNSNSWLKSDDETIMETELDLVELTLDEANQQNLNRNKILTEDFMKADFQSQVEILEKQVEIVDFASNIEASLQLIQPAASIANFIFSFIFPSNLILITNLMQLRLSQINSKLDKLLSNLNHMETRIKSSIVGNTFISTYMDWEYAIRNGAVKLRDIRHQMGLTQDKRRQRNLALDYITYYNNNQIEGNIMNLHRVSVTANNPTNRNLFDLFIEHQSCDVTQLSGLMIILKNLMTSAAQQTMTYYYFKGEKTRSKSWYSNKMKFAISAILLLSCMVLGTRAGESAITFTGESIREFQGYFSTVLFISKFPPVLRRMNP
ncbi:cephalotoxin-like protein [Chiloscyllium plagiosum]|uniref:cephalotoxin-like protein n=1 Tax=Chiloscyllium plagiosum TaxID=36176 RepID=UPI001CB7BC2C|nr:cephalotoxin-like protein [Chiloscyllium plagiosum]